MKDFNTEEELNDEKISELKKHHCGTLDFLRNLKPTCNQLATKSNVATMKKCYGSK